MAIMTACFVFNRIIPFGDNAIMVKDAWHQYYPFLREFQTLLKEGNLPLYSFNTGGGSDFLGVVGNYVASPLYWLSVFLPDSHRWLIGFLGFTVVLRIGFAGGFMALFLRKLFNRNDLSLVYFSLSYAFCGFILGYYWNVMWLDSVALMPVVVWGAYSVLKEGRFKLYIIALALSVICSFYIGFFICIFVLLFYLSVLYDEGFKAFVDGKEVEITPVAKTFCAFELEEGEHTIELRFTPQGMYMGLWVSCAGLIAFALLLIIYKKEKRNF